jgi:hypothetical protein
MKIKPFWLLIISQAYWEWQVLEQTRLVGAI